MLASLCVARDVVNEVPVKYKSTPLFPTLVSGKERIYLFPDKEFALNHNEIVISDFSSKSGLIEDLII